MNKFKTNIVSAFETGINKVSSTLILTILLTIFSVATGFAQVSKTNVQKEDYNFDSNIKQTIHQEEYTAIPPESNEVKDAGDAIINSPVINDAIINVKDEKQYLEKKKKEKEQQQNKVNGKVINEPK